MWLSMALLLPAAVVTNQGTEGKHPGTDFVLTAEVVTALEGGPLVVRVRLTYQGKKETMAWDPADFGQYLVGVHPDRSWQTRPLRFRFLYFGFFSPDRTTTIKPGTSWETTRYLHRDYQGIAAGEVKLRFEDCIYGPGRKAIKSGQEEVVPGPVIANPSVTITVHIPRATAEQVRALASAFEAKLRQPALSQEEAEHLADCILDCPHKEFIRTALQLIKVRCNPPRELIQFVYDRSATFRDAHALLIDHLREVVPPAGAEAIFRFWQPPPNPEAFVLPDDQLRRLCEAPNVWVNALTVLVFHRRCNPGWVSQVQEKVREHTRPFTAQEFSELLGQLDAERFSVREQAAATLLRRGDVVVPALRQALAQRLSVEVRTRIRRLLADLEQQPIDPRASEALALLKASAVEVREARDLLLVLGQGPPHASLTKQARAALAAVDGTSRQAPSKGRR